MSPKTHIDVDPRFGASQLGKDLRKAYEPPRVEWEQEYVAHLEGSGVIIECPDPTGMECG